MNDKMDNKTNIGLFIYILLFLILPCINGIILLTYISPKTIDPYN